MREPPATFTQMGIAAMLPGMRHMVTLMQRQIAELESLLESAQNGTMPKRGRPPKTQNPEEFAKRSSGNSDYWAKLTPAERSKEIRRRQEVSAGKRKPKGKPKAKMHPRDPRHPEHEAWRKKLRSTVKKSWGNLTPDEHKARVAKMLASRMGRKAA